jgi:hypothetical protein
MQRLHEGQLLAPGRRNELHAMRAWNVQ